MNEHGTAIIGWAQNTYEDTQLWTTSYTLSTGWGEAVLHAVDTAFLHGPQVAIDDDGFGAAIWATSSTMPVLRGVQHDPEAGGGWGPAELVPLPEDSWGSQPAVAMGADGSTLAVWVQSVDEVSLIDDELWSNGFTPRGTWGTPVSIGFGSGASSPALATNRSGTAVAVWTEIPADDVELRHVWSARSEPGSGWTTPELIQAVVTDPGLNPKVAIDSRGGATAVWGQRSVGVDHVWAARFTGSAGWGAPETIDAAPTEASLPWVGMDGDGGSVVIWLQRDFDSYTIWSTRDGIDSGWGAPEQISDEIGSVNEPTAAIGAEGDVVAVWTQSAPAGNELWSNRYVPGIGWGDPEFIDVGPASVSEDPDVAIDGNGNAIVVWANTDGGAANLWANISRKSL